MNHQPALSPVPEGFNRLAPERPIMLIIRRIGHVRQYGHRLITKQSIAHRRA